MHVVMVCVGLRLEGCNSLKDKRRVVRGLVQRLRNEFCVSVSEVGDQDLWGNAEIGMACVSESAVAAERVVQAAVEMVEAHPQVVLLSVTRDSVGL